MAGKEEETLRVAEKLLREAGYIVTRGLGINFSQVEAASCGAQCTGGCLNGCYTCSPGSSNKATSRLDPVFQISGGGILEDLVTVSRSFSPVEEKTEK